MAERRGVLMVFYDLPSTSPKERRDYTRFCKELLRQGYTGLQESVYIKLLRSSASAAEEMKKLRSIAPQEGNLSALPLSLNSVKELVTIRGEAFDMSRFSDDIVCL